MRALSYMAIPGLLGLPEPIPRLDLGYICQKVLDSYNRRNGEYVTVENLRIPDKLSREYTGPTEYAPRKRHIVAPRQLSMMLAFDRRITSGHTLMSVGAYFGRSHSAVVMARKSAEADLVTYRYLAIIYREVLESIIADVTSGRIKSVTES